MALASLYRRRTRLPADPTVGERLPQALFDVAPYGSVGPDGLFSGASVDLWRRVAEEMHWRYQFTLVSRMDAILAGLEQDRFDAAIGAITITAERLARVDFSYPAHRSGVAAAFARKTGLLSALSNYRAAASELGTLLAIMLGLLVAIGGLMWALERPGGPNGACGGVRGAHVARRPLLGGGHDDHGRLWRQDAEDFDRPLPGGALDAREPRA